MTQLFDPQDDFQQVVDGLEEVTLTPLDGSPTQLLRALRRPPTQQEVNLLNDSIGLKLDDVVWHFSDEALDGYLPQNGDTLTDGEAVVWTIVSTSRKLFGNHWRVICQNYA